MHTDNIGEAGTIAGLSFDSDESRDASVRIDNTQPVGRSKPVGNLIVLGQHQVSVATAHSGILDRLAPELKREIPTARNETVQLYPTNPQYPSYGAGKFMFWAPAEKSNI
ncbi:MAG: hypothetical protein WCF90_07815 [Methanomicrobiales archaeon]